MLLCLLGFTGFLESVALLSCWKLPRHVSTHKTQALITQPSSEGHPSLWQILLVKLKSCRSLPDTWGAGLGDHLEPIHQSFLENSLLCQPLDLIFCTLDPWHRQFILIWGICKDLQGKSGSQAFLLLWIVPVPWWHVIPFYFYFLKSSLHWP